MKKRLQNELLYLQTEVFTANDRAHVGIYKQENHEINNGESEAEGGEVQEWKGFGNESNKSQI